MEDNVKVMYFDTDNDFYDFCVVPQLVARSHTLPSGETYQYMDFDLSPAYYDAVDNGVNFIIRDADSRIINRNNTISYRTCSKKVNNLYDWSYEKYFKKLYPNHIVWPQQPIMDDDEDNNDENQ